MVRDMWIDGCKVDISPWLDGKRIYVNVQYYVPGQSIHQSPAWDKTVYVTDNAAGRMVVSDYAHSLVRHIANMQISEDTEVALTFGGYGAVSDKEAQDGQ